MAKLNQQAIRDLALEIVAIHTGGIRYRELIKAVQDTSPETPTNTIHRSVWDLHQRFPTKISKPSRGLFVPVVAPDVLTPSVPPVVSKLREDDFYKPFADWLRTDLEEVIVATPLGGAGMKTKWGTPDVVGIYKPLASNLIKFPIEIVSAEIKIDPQQPVVAFGQAIAYRLFSSKTYMALPATMSLDQRLRIPNFSR